MNPELLAPIRTVVLAILLAGLVGLAWFAWNQGLEPVFYLLNTLDSLVETRWTTTAVVFVASFAVGTTLTLPIGSIMCLAAGYLFGALAGSALALGGGMGGALLTFILVRHLGGATIKQRIRASRGGRLLDILERDAFYWLVVLRIVPVAPFFVINAAAAITRVRLGRYFTATTLGLIPTTLIYATAGAGIGSLMETRELAGPRLLLEPRILVPLLALATIITATAWMRRRMARQTAIRGSSARTKAAKYPVRY